MRNLYNPYRSKVILLLLTVFISLTIQAQLNYTFTATTGTYTANSGGAILVNTDVDDAYSAARDIGFTFTYGCNRYSKFKASSNGFISLGDELTDAMYLNDMAATGQGPLLAPLWDDLRTRATTSTVNFVVTGTAPNRVLTVEWLNMRWDLNASTDVISFQVKLYETSNNIEFIYKAGAVNPNNASASIGISGGTTAGDFYSLNGTGAAPTAVYGTGNNGLTARPANNRLYRFSPAGICASPGNERANLAFWIKGNAGTSSTTNGATISSWNDQSGNVRNATSAASATSPVYYDNSTNNVNFNPVVNFDASAQSAATADFMDITAGGILSTGNNAYTVYTVIKPGTGNQSTPGKFLFSGVYDAGGNMFNSFDIRSNGSFNDSWCLNDLIVNGQWTPAYPSLATYDYNSSQRQMFIAGTSVATKVNTAVRNSPDQNCALGCQRAVTPNKEFYDGSIAEIVSYTNATHNATARNKVESYLALKYGITLSHNYLSSTGATVWNRTINPAYNTNIIGVARDDNSALSQKQSKSTSVTTDILTLYIGATKQTNQVNNNGAFASGDRSFFIAANNNEPYLYTTAVTEVPAGICCRLRREWLSQKSNFTNTDLKLEFDFNVITPGYVALNVADLRLLVDNDGDFTNATILSSPAVSISVNAGVVTVTVAASNFTGTPYFTLASASISTPLPVKFVKLGANCKANAANISWTTENETNTDHYTVERSADGKSFIAMADVNSNAAASQQHVYNWTDAAPLPGTSYYRLKIAGSTSVTGYSPVFTFIDCGTEVVRVANNIINGDSELFLQLAKNARMEIELFDVLGRRYTVVGLTGKQDMAQGTYRFPVTSNLRTGIYLLSVTINGNKKLFRLVK
ncbi:MAG TPA: T9SS type A sorting domain-containing protein [Niastella sp.]